MNSVDEQLRRLAYLDAMGVQVWQVRDKGCIPDELLVEPETVAKAAASEVIEPQAVSPVLLEAKSPSVSVVSGVDDVASECDIPDLGMPPLDAYSLADMPPDEFDESRYDDLPVVTPSPLTWEALQEHVKVCDRCELHCHRSQTVFGSGDANADVMFISEAPGVDDDVKGLPLMGEPGQLLDLMLKSINTERKNVYLTNVVKCHPPKNRDLHVDELMACSDYLIRQIELVNPRLIVAVGRVSAQKLLDTKKNLSDLRTKVHSFGSSTIPVIVTYHPAYLLRSPQEKRKSWDDLLTIRDCINSFPELPD